MHAQTVSYSGNVLAPDEHFEFKMSIECTVTYKLKYFLPTLNKFHVCIL